MIQYYVHYTLDTTNDEGVQAPGVQFTGMTTINAEIADDDEAISNQISNETGWLVESYSVNS